MYKALVIGCGNIGAGYDLGTDQVLTHAKAFGRHPDFELSLYDHKPEVARAAAEVYGALTVTELDESVLGSFDVVSICTPTATHTEFLQRLMRASVKVLICEKPIAPDLHELTLLHEQYQSSQSAILVNYIRRFQPAYLQLKTFLTTRGASERLLQVRIAYQRGFLNNCSHAFDLVGFLMGKPLSINSVRVSETAFDAFKDDPTLSLQAFWDTTLVTLQGLSGAKYAIFEIELFFETFRLRIKDSGMKIDLIQDEVSTDPAAFLSPKLRSQAIKNYMIPVINKAHELLRGQGEDNFLNALALNRNMLGYLETIHA